MAEQEYLSHAADCDVCIAVPPLTQGDLRELCPEGLRAFRERRLWPPSSPRRLLGIRETLDRPFYDTRAIAPGQEVRLFDHTNIGDRALTNIDLPGQLSARGGTYLIYTVGLRIIGTSREEEDVLLDHFEVLLILGDKPYGRFPGALVSTRRYASEPEVEDKPELDPLAQRPQLGYALRIPVGLPRRMNFRPELIYRENILGVRATKTVVARVFISGLHLRDVQ